MKIKYCRDCGKKLNKKVITDYYYHAEKGKTYYKITNLSCPSYSNPWYSFIKSNLHDFVEIDNQGYYTYINPVVDYGIW